MQKNKNCKIEIANVKNKKYAFCLKIKRVVTRNSSDLQEENDYCVQKKFINNANEQFRLDENEQFFSHV